MLVVDKLVELNERLVQSPHVATIEIPLPDAKEREQFVPVAAGGSEISKFADFTCRQLAEDLQRLDADQSQCACLRQAGRNGKRLDAMRFRQLKKSMIERQCQGLVEIRRAEAHAGLGRRARCSQGAAAAGCQVDQRRPTGSRRRWAILICGPVGTGKTFLAECYAGSIGIPCVVLRNFRSKYVGETEGNLEQVLGVLRSLGPVVVIVDEADAALGNRQADGDSGTSARVFSMIASQMGDTRYPRPDHLDAAHQPARSAADRFEAARPGGSAHSAVLSDQGRRHRFSRCCRMMAKKNKVQLADDAIPAVDPARRLSGADLESIVLGVEARWPLAGGREQSSAADLEQALARVHSVGPGIGKGSCRKWRPCSNARK